MFGFLVGIFTGIWNAVETVALTLATVITTIWSIIRPILNPLWSGVRFVFNDVVKPFWLWAKAHLEQLKAIYDAHVKPIVDRVLGVVRTVKRIWSAVLQPIFDTISALQTFLVVTHLNQTALGAWLDDELGRVYQVIADIDARFLRPLNALLHVVNEIILDVDGVFRYAILVESTGRHIATISNQAWNRSLGRLKNHRGADGGLARLEEGEAGVTVDDARAALLGDESDLAPLLDEGREIFLAGVAGDWSPVAKVLHPGQKPIILSA